MDIECGLTSIGRFDAHRTISEDTEEWGVVGQYTDITFEGAR
jgi:hypothetical protein